MDDLDRYFVDQADSTGVFGPCDREGCSRPANAVRKNTNGDYVPVCDNHSIPGEVGIVYMQALQDLYDDWQGPLTEAARRAQALLQAARDSIDDSEGRTDG